MTFPFPGPNYELYLCWVDSETYSQVTKPRNGSVYPWPLNYIQTFSKRNKVCKQLKVMGWYTKSLEDVFQQIENCCQALTDRLDNKEYFYGKSYTELDALVYGHVYSMLKILLPTGNNRLFFLVKKYKPLIDHCKKLHSRIMQQKAVTAPCSSISQIETEIGDFELDYGSLTTPRDNESSSTKVAVTFTEVLINPTELDALVFGHLFTILTTPLPNNQMANIIRNFPSLINLVQRIERNYFKRQTKT